MTIWDCYQLLSVTYNQVPFTVVKFFDIVKNVLLWHFFLYITSVTISDCFCNNRLISPSNINDANLAWTRNRWAFGAAATKQSGFGFDRTATTRHTWFGAHFTRSPPFVLSSVNSARCSSAFVSLVRTTNQNPFFATHDFVSQTLIVYVSQGGFHCIPESLDEFGSG